jgi:allantoicase
LLERTRLEPDTRGEFVVSHAGQVSAIRLDAFPAGGLSRVRAIGSIDPAARRAAGYRWFNSLPASQAMAVLVDAGLSAAAATDVIGRRPLEEGWFGGPGSDLPGQIGDGASREALAMIFDGSRHLAEG